MNLHGDQKLFSQSIRAASQLLNIREEFIEKDYWITDTLAKLSSSKYLDQVVFKGGTSLTKAHKLIKRFSEDIDLAIIHDDSKAGNQVKNLIRSVEKTITVDLKITNTDLASKGSRFRKTYYQYPSLYPSHGNNLIIEINSFANPFPYSRVEIASFIYDFLIEKQELEMIKDYKLKPISINVLDINQTMLEKLVSLFRTSFEIDLLKNISRKIRHFYDLYYLLSSKQGKAFTKSDKFKSALDELWLHDKMLFDEPKGWQDYSYLDSPIIQDFDSIWSKIAKVYKTEMSALAFAEIPKEDEVFQLFKQLFKAISS
ncbi:MAG: nucleotidyl transferase AbiEii/AbiGii toxin family protein [Candidatus Caenarcaniphilales bacterium]|nr:nucleotidyl transferase AbiEii/AbiGii toxin family protein [Candidatus Caenarcaniphilales bacterium]